MNQLSRISPISDADAARTVQASTLADLAGQITATPVTATPVMAAGRRRRLTLIAMATPALAGAAAAVVIVATASQPAPVKAGHPSRPPARGTTQLAAALSFTTSGRYITVRVVDPLADASRYRAEFARHHLNVTLNLVPASPSLVGTLVYFDDSAGSAITPITAQGRCYTGGGGSACPVGVRIPAGYRGQAQLVFGRAARPGEQYETTASATAPGEALHGLTVDGLRVTRVLALVRQRDVTVPVYHYDGKLLRHVPGDWYVYDADPWAPGQVMLFTGPTWPQPAANSPVPGNPVPTPTRA